MTPRERAWHYATGAGKNWKTESLGLAESNFIHILTEIVTADRQALQSEMRQKIDEYSSDLPSVKERMLHIVQAVFARQSQPEELKPERLMISQEEFNRCIRQANENYEEAERRYQACYAELSRVQAESDRRVLAEREACVTIADNEASKAEHWQYMKGAKEGAKEISRLIRARSNQSEESRPFSVFKPADSYFISVEESDRRVLAEREACAKICDAYEVYCKSAFPVIHKPMEFGIGVSIGLAHNIRARSNQPEEKPNLTPFDPECSTCVREADEAADRAAKRVERMISSADRIATLHEWQAKDALTIQQLNESNNALSEKVAQLKKEKYELTQIVEYAKDDAHKNHYRGCSCLLCQPSPAD